MTDGTISSLSVASQAATPAGSLVPSGPVGPPTASRSIVRRLVGAIVVFVVIGIGGVAWARLSDAPETARIGDCLAGRTADSLRTIDCTNPAAAHKVVGRIEDRTEAEVTANDVTQLCAAYPTARSVYWEGRKGGKGYLLCLEPLG